MPTSVIRVFRPNQTCEDIPLHQKKCYSFGFMCSVIFHINATTCTNLDLNIKFKVGGVVLSLFHFFTYYLSDSMNGIYENDNGFSRGSDHIITRVLTKCQLEAVLTYLYC